MKKLLFSAVALMAANFAFAQLTLEHSFTNEDAFVYSSPTETFYVSKTTDHKLKVYNSSYALYKTVTVPMPAGFNRLDFYGEAFSISKNIFNTDSKFEFMVSISNDTYTSYKLILINEDGTLIKDFHTDPNKLYDGGFNVFHDGATNTNKLIVHSGTAFNNSSIPLTEVYSLPTSVLTAKEIQAGSQLSAFPIPTNKILNVVNPGSGANKIEVFDVTGKLVLNQSFSASEGKISVDVESLPKGIYIYKIGTLSSKFTKN
ncbi:T9SS C-terminal target domain-containing protein [Chryseobacterium indologenes]|uniref:T9SS type A sorting domain-containing protein n=1 Tax=Chryseobacterium indologenes TaxID=253 RepID=UPI000B516BFC|nr:T9SS type A sorting domain-containing protein [Chryseobacterium indologenes]ASE63100.1 T9SS C-terminal target domain-containing protein [Chryseobacterium indologenes]AYZ37988.1 T9SS C-terminal target domain-containing protein [Chryseobacterium indologenes]MBF6646911.1 T9SS type A sorting domain-containing protein [Chryseobacterium indologenes]MBU3047132.1 T9SS type A sorting domain-containing protein [Chryseobacterium indologenes]MEB4761260.1 T9SS type A sorting domain-containing protein [C